MTYDHANGLDRLLAKLTDPSRRRCMESKRYEDGAIVYCTAPYGKPHVFPSREDIEAPRKR